MQAVNIYGFLRILRARIILLRGQLTARTIGIFSVQAATQVIRPIIQIKRSILGQVLRANARFAVTLASTVGQTASVRFADFRAPTVGVTANALPVKYRTAATVGVAESVPFADFRARTVGVTVLVLPVKWRIAVTLGQTAGVPFAV